MAGGIGTAGVSGFGVAFAPVAVAELFTADFFTSALVITFFVVFFFGPPFSFAALTSGESSAWPAMATRRTARAKSFFMGLMCRHDRIDLRGGRRRRARASRPPRGRYPPTLPSDESSAAECETP